MLETIESVEARADAEARQARDFITNNQAANAREIAESVEEPAILIEKLILAINGKGNVFDRYDAVEALLSDATRDYANEQAELAYHHVIHTPG